MLAGMKPDLAFAEVDGFRHAKRVFKKHPHKKSAPQAKAVQPPAPSPSQGDGSAPFEPKLARLAEILGALSYLQPLCSGNPVYDWQGETMALILAEAKSELDKGSIIGAFNHGFRGYALSYRVCTPNAQKIIARFVSEGANLSQDIVNRYSSS
jgi:uncharacterized protein (TIGR02301 family)